MAMAAHATRWVKGIEGEADATPEYTLELHPGDGHGRSFRWMNGQDKRQRAVAIPYTRGVITVLFFASIAQVLGLRRTTMAVQPGDTVATVRDRLVDEYPVLKPFVENLMYALDEEYAGASTPVSEGTTLALIPPVSGG